MGLSALIARSQEKIAILDRADRRPAARPRSRPASPSRPCRTTSRSPRASSTASPDGRGRSARRRSTARSRRGPRPTRRAQRTRRARDRDRRELAQAGPREDEDTRVEELVKGAAAVRAASPLRGACTIVRMAEERPKPDAERKPATRSATCRSRRRPSCRRSASSYDRTIDRAPAAARDPARARAARGGAAVAGAALLGAQEGRRSTTRRSTRRSTPLRGTKLEDEKLAPRAARRRAPRAARGQQGSVHHSWRWRCTPLRARRRGPPTTRATASWRCSWPVYIEGLHRVAGRQVAPDANCTLRITYGTVRGYSRAPTGRRTRRSRPPRRSSAKNTGKEPFDAPRDAARRRSRPASWGPYASPELGELPVDFLSTSTSPAATRARRSLNARASSSASPSTATSRASPPTSSSTARHPHDPRRHPLHAVDHGRRRRRRSPARGDGRRAGAVISPARCAPASTLAPGGRGAPSRPRRRSPWSPARPRSRRPRRGRSD